MNIAMNPWAVAVLIELILVAAAAAVFFYLRIQAVRDEVKVQLDEAAAAVEAARNESRRVQEEAMRKRTIVTFDEADLEALANAGEMVGDAETFDELKKKLVESSEVLSTMATSASDLNGKLAEVMEKQMEAVNMVGRLGGTGGLPPELKEKAEAILDVFRTMDEILGQAYEEMDKVESGVGEVSAAIADFKDADPAVKLPTAEVLNRTLKQKAGVDDEDAVEAILSEGAEASEPPMNAFDGDEGAEARV